MAETLEAPPAAPVAATPPPAPPPAPAKPSAVPGARATTKAVTKPAATMKDAYAALEKMGQAELGTNEVTPPKKTEVAPPDEGTEPTETAPETPPVTPAAKPEKAGTLRENYEKLKTQLAEREAKLKEFEAKAQTPAEDPEKKQITEKLTQAEARAKELEEKLKFADYKESPEFQKEYWEPFASAYDAGRTKVTGLNLTDPKDGSLRRGTAEDFDALMKISDDDAAAELAFEMFGNKSAMVLWHREKVNELNNRKNTALETMRTKGGEQRLKQKEEWETQSKKLVTEATETWKKSVTEPHEKLPHYFKPVAGDTKRNELLEAGFKQSTEAFKIMNVLDPKLTSQQREAAIKSHAVVFNKAAAFDALAYQASEDRKRYKEALEKLKAYEDSEPGGGSGGRKPKTPPGSAMDAAKAGIAALAGR